MTNLEVVTPNLRGSCVTVENRLHGLFKIVRRNEPADVAPLRWHVEPADRPGIPDEEPAGSHCVAGG